MGYRKLLFLLPILALLASCDRDPKAARQRYLSNGNKYFEKKKYKEASIMYRKALQKDMRYGEAWYRLGLTNMELGQFGEARRDFSRTTELEPNNLDAITKLADIDFAAYIADEKNRKQALADLKEMIELLHKKDPNNYDYYRLEGYLALTQKDFAGAIPNFERALQIKPDQPAVIHSLVQCLLATNQPDKAERYATDLISKHKDFGPIYDTMYAYYLSQKRPDSAEQILKEKVANNPAQGAYRVELAIFYFRENRKDEIPAVLKPLTTDTKTFPNGHLLAGDFYGGTRNFSAAQQEYETGERQDPKNKRVYEKKMIELVASEGKTEEVGKRIAALLKEDPKDPDAISMQADYLLKTGDRSKSKEIISDLQPLVAKYSNNPLLHYNLGRAYMEAGDIQSRDQARIQFEAALKLNPNYIPPKIALAQLDLARGNGADAVQRTDEILAVDKNDPSVLLIRAMGLASMGEHDKARDLFNQIIATWPKLTDAKYQLAILDGTDRKFPEAEQLFTELRNAGEVRGTMGLVETKVAQGKFDDALSLVRQQLEKTPGDQQFQVALANIEFRAGKYNEAASQFEKLTAANPKGVGLFLGLGESKQQAGDLNGAIAAYKMAHTVAPNDPQPLLELGILYDQQGRSDQARQQYEQVLKIQPDNFVALNNLAYAKADSGVDLDQALAYAQRAQQKQPNNLNVMDTVALIYIRKNLTDDGVRVLKDLISRAPEKATFHLHLALAYYAKGDREAAKQELATAMRDKPDNKDQARIKELMAKLG